jgi:hypothetical protein
MHIILKKSDKKIEVLNIFYGDDTNLINNWIKEYINDDIESLKNLPLIKDVHTVLYEIVENKNEYELIKRVKKINKGYIYNSSERSTENIYTINLLEYDGINKFNFEQYTLKENSKWADINSEINTRVLKQLDKESLYQILGKIQGSIKLKSNWNYTEYTSLVSEILKTFKKDVYSSLAKRLKRFGKKQKHYNNFTFSIEQSSTGSCKLESLSKDKIE